jgi:Carbohydrate binding domain
MNVILKPAGVVVVLATFGVLAFVALPKKKERESVAPPPRAPVSVTSPAASGDGSNIELSTRSSAKIDWKKAKQILQPDITGSNWRMLVGKGKMENTVVPSSIAGHSFARRLVVKELGANAWDLQIAHPLEVAFKKGSHVRLTYWGRSKDRCSLAAVVEQAQEPYTKITSRNVTLSPEWKQYAEEWQQTADTEPGWAHINFQVGYKSGELELTGVQLVEVP